MKTYYTFEVPGIKGTTPDRLQSAEPPLSDALLYDRARQILESEYVKKRAPGANVVIIEENHQDHRKWKVADFGSCQVHTLDEWRKDRHGRITPLSPYWNRMEKYVKLFSEWEIFPPHGPKEELI